MKLTYAALLSMLLPFGAGIATTSFGFPWYGVVLSTIPATLFAVLSLARHPHLRESVPVELGWLCGMCGPTIAGASMQFSGNTVLATIGAFIFYGFGSLWLPIPVIAYLVSKRMRSVDFWRKRGEGGVLQLINILQNSGTFIGSLDAAELLGSLGDRRAVEPLIQTVQSDPDPVIRQAAAQALGKLGDERALPALREMQQHDQGTDDDEHPIRDTATMAIREIERLKAP